MATNNIQLCDLELAKKDLHNWEWGTDSALEIEHRIAGAETVLDQMEEVEGFLNYPELNIWPIGGDYLRFEINLEIALSDQLARSSDWSAEDLELVARSLRNLADKFQNAADIDRTVDEQKRQTIQKV